MKRYKIIANPHAGRGKAQRIITETVRLLRARNVAFDLAVTTGPGDAEALAARTCEAGGFSAIISLGGDGTLNEVIQKTLFSGMPLAVIPAGSGNDFSKTLNTPGKLDQVIDMVLAGRTKVIDAGKLNDRYFINGVGFGFDAAVNKATRAISWPKAGLAVYFLAFLRTLNRYSPVTLKIGINGETLEQQFFLVSIGNGTTCGGGFKLTPHAETDDGLLDITMVSPLSIPRLFWHLPKVFNGTIDRTHHAVAKRFSSLTIESRQLDIPVHIDGEVYASTGTSYEIAVVPKALSVIGNFA